MKNLTALVVVVAFVTLSAVCIVEWKKSSNGQAKIQSIQNQLDEKSRQAEELQSANNRLKVEQRELQWKVDLLTSRAQAAELAQTQSSSSNSTTETNASQATSDEKKKTPFAGFLSKMMKDPEMKKFIRNQQGMMLDQFYGPLLKELGLSPDEAAKFKEMLLDRQMKGAELATSLMGGSQTNRTEMLNAMSAEHKAFDQELKDFLGDARFDQYKDYEKTLTERMQLNQFKQQMAGEATALTDNQTEQLLAIMSEEKSRVSAASGQSFPEPGQSQAAVDAFSSDERLQALLDDQQQVSQRVIERAAGILSPEQLQSFGRFQTNQLQLMRMGMTMARKMFAPEQPNNNAAPASQQSGY